MWRLDEAPGASGTPGPAIAARWEHGEPRPEGRRLRRPLPLPGQGVQEVAQDDRPGRRAGGQARRRAGRPPAPHRADPGAPGVDPGDFILSGGTLKQAAPRRAIAPSIVALIDDYLANQSHVAPSYLSTQAVHLRNFRKKLGRRADTPCDRLAHRDLDQYLQARLKERKADTVGKERFPLVKLFEWAVAHGYLDASPAAGLAAIKGDADKQPFGTVAEIEAILARGGLDDAEAATLWDCL